MSKIAKPNKNDLKLDIFPHIFPRLFFDRMKHIAEANPALAASIKRWLTSRCCGTSTRASA